MLFRSALLGEAVYQYQKKTVRKMILKDHKRPDGRAIDQIRPLAAEIDLIPRVHGSAMFTRGQTQICTITTLAPLAEAQRLDGLDEAETSKRYMHHYNFPSYSVGETRPSRGPGRRENPGLGITVGGTVAATTTFMRPDHQTSFGQGSTGAYDSQSGSSWGPRIEGQEYERWDGTVGHMRYYDSLENYMETGVNLQGNVTFQQQ